MLAHTLYLSRLLFFMKMDALLKGRGLVGRYLIEFKKLMVLSLTGKTSRMMGKRLCLLLAYLLRTSSSLLLFLKMSLQTG